MRVQASQCWLGVSLECARGQNGVHPDKDCVYVALSDPGSMKYSYILEQSPRDWETNIRQNLVLTIFHTQNICHHAWKTVRITLQCIVGLQSRGEGPEI